MRPVGDTFELQFQAELFQKSEEGQPVRCSKGFASTSHLDRSEETILQNGINFQPLRDEGYINWDHQKLELDIQGARVPAIIGVPTLVELRPGGLWTEGELFKAGDDRRNEFLQLADTAWDLGQTLQKSGRRGLAYSIEGRVTERRGKKIVKSVATDVALTWKPVNPACSVELFAKSMLCCGRCSPDHPEFNPAHRCGNKVSVHRNDELGPALEKALGLEQGAILRENLDMGLTSVLYGNTDCGHFDRGSGRFENGAEGALAHLTQCRGFSKEQAKELLRRMIQAAKLDAWVAALVKRAGIVRS